MMRSALAPATVLIAVLAGPANAEPRALSGFTRVSASAGTQVQVDIGPAYSVDVSGRDAARIATRVANGALIVEPVRSWSWRGPRDALVRVTMPRVEGLDASSGARVRARGVNADALALEASSGANLEVFGACASFEAAASSGAHIQAAELRCENGDVDVSSGARVRVFASNRLDVDASSGGDVIAHGGAGIGNVDLSSGGSLRRAD